MRGDKDNKDIKKKKALFSSAFTLVELIVVVTIIVILATIGVVGYNSWRQATASAQLKSDLNTVATAMENYRNFNNGYPNTVPSSFNPSSGVTLSGGSDDGGVTFCITAVNSQFPGLSYHIDSTNNGPQSGVCVSQKLLATFAGTGGTVSAGGSYATNSVQTITATPNTNYSFSSWTGDTGCSGTASHTITMDANKTCTANFVTCTLTLIAGSGGTITGGGNNVCGTTPPITSTPSTYYSFTSWTGSTGCSGTATHNITMDTNKTCTANFSPTAIAAPSAPIVTPVTVTDTTTYSWGAASCPGNTARYQYDYTISPAGYDSGWTATASTSVAFTTTTEGQTYTVAVQAQCYNAATSSPWSSSGSGSYLRPITYQTLTLTPGTGGTVSGGGSFATGSSPTMTSTPNANYTFTSWTGSTGCSGTQVHTITMDAAKSCTANFTATGIATPANPIVTHATVGATTTFSWGAASCPGNSARYQYDYTYNTTPTPFDSGWTATALTSFAPTTSTGPLTYSLAVQAQCYNGGNQSAWSGSGTDSYLRPGGTGGTITYSGGRTIHTFTSSGSLVITGGPLSGGTVLIVAGGVGGAGGVQGGPAGSGGAGGKVTALSSQSFNGTTTVTVGAAGAASVFGGTTSSGTGATGGTPNGEGANGLPGAAGTSSSISGSSIYYGGGGGSGAFVGYPVHSIHFYGGAGGSGGGGTGGDAYYDAVGGWSYGFVGVDGAANTGGGGGGGGTGYDSPESGGNGGKGIVIVSYPTP
ncbi:MAG: prepilin-type N-terminal cleavage/methylation domain-containing protein [Candidatus Saccharibacteria bacterium]|nr:prepilin-type N-terminal cleavage/methylation domain-containing protein [Candidatus Saccharibacteria bacterium]